MTSIKVKFRSSAAISHNGAIYYHIVHKRTTALIETPYRIFVSEWDSKTGRVRMTDPTRSAQLISIRTHIHRDIERLHLIISRLNDRLIDYSACDIKHEYRRYSEEYTFIKYMESIIARLVDNGKLGTAENYRSALNSFKKFIVTRFSGIDQIIMLDSITPELMEQYQSWQLELGHIPNTISFYCRIFRAVYRRAIDEQLIIDRHPFRHVYTGVDKTEKRALPLHIIRQIKALDLSNRPRLDHARDIFLLSLYLRGMSFIDLCFLRKTDLRGDILSYRRRKTGQPLTIAWTGEMQKILDKYPDNRSPYLLPIITRAGINERYAYKNAAYRINRTFKEIGALIGAKDYSKWSLYRARHSWASLAKAKGIPISIISEAMGHDNEKTTQIYLASLENSIVDRANQLVISLI